MIWFQAKRLKNTNSKTILEQRDLGSWMPTSLSDLWGGSWGRAEGTKWYVGTHQINTLYIYINKEIWVIYKIQYVYIYIHTYVYLKHEGDWKQQTFEILGGKSFHCWFLTLNHMHCDFLRFKCFLLKPKHKWVNMHPNIETLVTLRTNISSKSQK